MNRDDVEIVEKNRKYEGFFAIDEYQVKHRLYNGDYSRTFKREIFERGNASAILLYDPKLDKVVLVEQFRIGALVANMNPWLLEIVAGINEEHESIEEVVKREAYEEAGVKVDQVKYIFDYLVSPGGTSEVISLFVGLVDSTTAKGVHGLKDENEDIKVYTYDFNEALELANTGKILNATTLIAIFYLAIHKDEFKN